MPLSGIGIGEMIIIAMLVLIVFGPQRLPEITRQLGRAMREFRRGMNEIQRELETADREKRWGQSGAVAAATARASAPAPDAGEATAAAPAEEDEGAQTGSGTGDSPARPDGVPTPDASTPEPTIAPPTVGPPTFGSDLPEEIESQLAPPPEATAVKPAPPRTEDAGEAGEAGAKAQEEEPSGEDEPEP